MKYHIISILHIMKSYETIMKSYIVCNITNIVYKIEDFDCYAYTPMGGNLCKYTYHLLYINATFIRLIHKYSKNIPFFVQFLYVFVPKLSKNCTKLAIFVPKLYKK